MVRDCCWCRNGVLAFIGFDAVSTAAQEAKIHKRNAYWYFRISVICTILYVLFAHVMTGLVPYKFVGDAKPAATVLL
jgi:APA family basic amino acid/polyamine antiporter